MHVSYLNIKPCSFLAVIYLSTNLNTLCSYKVKTVNTWIKIKYTNMFSIDQFHSLYLHIDWKINFFSDVKSYYWNLGYKN